MNPNLFLSFFSPIKYRYLLTSAKFLTTNIGLILAKPFQISTLLFQQQSQRPLFKGKHQCPLKCAFSTVNVVKLREHTYKGEQQPKSHK